MADTNSDYYVSLEDPKSFRRELLGSTKVIIKLLQRYEMLKIVREKKIKLMFNYSKSIAEINMLVNKLKKAIPKNKIKDLPVINEVTKQVYVQPSYNKIQNNTIQSKPTINVSRENNNLDELHNQLAEIEARLNSLN